MFEEGSGGVKGWVEPNSMACKVSGVEGVRFGTKLGTLCVEAVFVGSSVECERTVLRRELVVLSSVKHPVRAVAERSRGDSGCRSAFGMPLGALPADLEGFGTVKEGGRRWQHCRTLPGKLGG
jgi:hypothetical protein